MRISWRILREYDGTRICRTRICLEKELYAEAAPMSGVALSQFLSCDDRCCWNMSQLILFSVATSLYFLLPTYTREYFLSSIVYSLFEFSFTGFEKHQRLFS